MASLRRWSVLALLLLTIDNTSAQHSDREEVFTLVELNCENLFDCRHDALKDDYEFLPESARHWTYKRYWRHLNRTAQTILACAGNNSLPDLVALTEVENDSVLIDLTRRSLLRNAHYEYVMTDAPDQRGIDVALLYSPFRFRLLHSDTLRITPPPDMRPTRDILHVEGRISSGDTLHVFVVHAPSRSQGERATRPYRQLVADRLLSAVDTVRQRQPQAKIIVTGDFNDYAGEENLQRYAEGGLTDVSANATGTHGAHGTYRYQGRWGSLDHILLSPSLTTHSYNCYIFDAPFLLTKDKKYGGVQPRRNYLGPRFLNGFSDHLPLVLELWGTKPSPKNKIEKARKETR